MNNLKKNLRFKSGRVRLERMEFLCPQCLTNRIEFSLLWGGLTERIINMLTSPVWASHRPALSYADTNSRLSMCASHGFHMKRYRCYSQLRTPGITFYPGKLTQPNESFHPGSAQKLHSPSYSAYSLHCQFRTMPNLVLWFLYNHNQSCSAPAPGLDELQGISTHFHQHIIGKFQLYKMPAALYELPKSSH